MLDKIINLFISKQESKETTKEIKRSNGDTITTKTTTTTTIYTIPEEAKEVLIKDIHNIIRDKKEI